MVLKGYTTNEIIVSILILLVGFSFTYFALVYPSITGYTVAISECETREVPYTVQETYTVSEPYVHTFYEDVPISYVVEKEDAINCYGKSSPWGACISLIIKNTDDSGGIFSVKGYIDKYNIDTDKFTGRSEETQSENIEPNEKHEFSFILDRDFRDNWIYFYDIEAPTKSIEKTETRYQDVTKTRTLTKYRTEKVC